MMARRFAILRPHPTVGTARSRCDAVQRPLSAGSRAASMKRHAMSPALWPRLKRSNNRAAKESALKCCSPISSASSSLVAFGFVARAAHRTSSRSRLSRRTYAGSPNWSLDHHRWPRLVLRKRCGRQCPCSKGPAAKRSGRNRWLQDIEKNTSPFPSPTFATKSASNRQVAVARDALYFGRTHLNLRDILWSYVRSPNAITHYGIVPSHSTGAPFARAEFSANHHALFGRVRATRVESDAY